MVGRFLVISYRTVIGCVCTWDRLFFSKSLFTPLWEGSGVKLSCEALNYFKEWKSDEVFTPWGKGKRWAYHLGLCLFICRKLFWGPHTHTHTLSFPSCTVCGQAKWVLSDCRKSGLASLGKRDKSLAQCMCVCMYKWIQSNARPSALSYC